MSNILSSVSQNIQNLKQDISSSGQTSKTTFTPSGFFADITKGVQNIEQSFLGPDYEYWNKIKNPTDLGMSGDGNLDALAKDVAGLIGYVELLVAGGGPASKEPGPLGNKFFLKTPSKCKTPEGNTVNRWIYINNVPTGNIPFISSLLNENFPDFRGLVPGVMENIGKINPITLFKSFMIGSDPSCVQVTMPVSPTNMNQFQTTETQYVLASDAANLQGFQTMFEDNNKIKSNIPDGIVPKLYFTALGGLLLYILYLIVMRVNKLNRK